MTDKELIFNENSTSKDNANKTHTVIAYKYSNNKRETLHESVILEGHPMFIRYKNGQVEAVEQIDEDSRIIRPPRKGEYPYPYYEFSSMVEVEAYMNRAKMTSIHSLYSKAKEIDQKYIDQEEPIIILLAASKVWTYFQDLFSTTPYINIIGDNETGKSSVGLEFQYTGYRPVIATSISIANYYRTLGAEEQGQCTIIEDEADNIEEDHEKMKILKSGYEYSAKVPKVNMNTRDQSQTWFSAYCFKMFISEKPLNPVKAKGLVERTLTLHCKPTTSNSLCSIKEVIINPPGDLKKQELYKELIDFRKLMLCYRLIHYKDTIPDFDTGLRNRDKELGNPLLRLFSGTEAYEEIKYALEKFLSERKGRKQKTIKSALQPMIAKLLAKSTKPELSVGQIWDALPQHIPGTVNPQNSNEYQTTEYGTLYRNTLSQMIEGMFGATRKRKSDGSVLIFASKEIKEFQRIYESQSADKNPPHINFRPKKKEGANTMDDGNEGCISSEGCRVCGFIIEEIEE
jgi:hypothetical protein